MAAGHGIVVREIITDNAKNYIHIADAEVKHRPIRPHRPWQNGKRERFNR